MKLLRNILIILPFALLASWANAHFGGNTSTFLSVWIVAVIGQSIVCEVDK